MCLAQKASSFRAGCRCRVTERYGDGWSPASGGRCTSSHRDLEQYCAIRSQRQRALALADLTMILTSCEYRGPAGISRVPRGRSPQKQLVRRQGVQAAGTQTCAVTDTPALSNRNTTGPERSRQVPPAGHPREPPARSSSGPPGSPTKPPRPFEPPAIRPPRFKLTATEDRIRGVGDSVLRTAPQLYLC